MNHILKFFPFKPLHYKAAEIWLNEQALQGLELVTVNGLGFAVFRPAERPCTYSVLLWNGKTAVYTHDDFKEFKELCEAGGATYITGTGSMRIFALHEGVTPLESDDETAFLQIKRIYTRSIVATAVLFGLSWLYMLANETFHDFYLHLSSPIYVGLCLLLAIMPIYFVFLSIEAARFLKRTRRCLEEGIFPFTSVKIAYRQGTTRNLLAVLFGIMVVALLLFGSAQQTSTSYLWQLLLFQLSFSFVLRLRRKQKEEPLPQRKVLLRIGTVAVIGTLIGIFWATSAGNGYGSEYDADLTRYGHVPALRAVTLDASGPEAQRFGPPYYRFQYSRTPFATRYDMHDYTAHESIISLCVDGGNAFIANKLFDELAYSYSDLAYLRRYGLVEERVYVPVFLPFADRALYDGEGVYVIQKGQRVVRVKKVGWSESHPEDPAFIERIREAYFAGS